MSVVLQALIRAFGQLSDPAILRIVVRSVLVTLLIFGVFGLALYAGLTWLLDWMDLTGGAGPDTGWLNEVLAVLATLIASWLLFRVVAVAVLQFFADQVVKAIEASDYREAARHARALGLREEMSNSARGIGRTLGLNLLALPVAGVLLVTGIGPAAVFFAVNAWLLGRELTDMAWLRYRSSPQEHSPVPRGQRLMLGGAVAGIMLVPFINLVAPLIGAAAGTHLAHQAMKQSRAQEEDVSE
ncbi:MAG: EI24 domain-containing protein [Pseudomonadota bacterium]